MYPVRTLLVDDNRRFRNALTRFLATCDTVTVVGEAATGRAAVTAVNDLRPELVLMDLAMPEMGGIEATEVIKRDPNPPRIVIVTLDDAEEYRARAQGVGADGMLSKASLLTGLDPLVRRMFC